MTSEGDVPGRTGTIQMECSPCSKMASHYCTRCEVFFCTSCLEKHNAVLLNHRITDLDDDGRGVTPIVTSLPTDVCMEHMKITDMYCQDDDTIGCSTCMAMDHRACNRLFYLPKEAGKLVKDAGIDALKAELGNIIERLESVRIRQEDTRSGLDKDMERCFREIDDHREQLIVLLDRVVKSSKDKVGESFKNMSHVLDHNHQLVENKLTDLKDGMDRLENNQCNLAQSFIEIKKCKAQMKATETILAESLENLKVRGFGVDIDGCVNGILRGLQSLVTINRRAPVRLKKMDHVDVSCTGDLEACRILGSCILNDGSILLSDLSNKKLKRLDGRTLKIIDQCTLQEKPIDVSFVKDNEVVVTQTNRKLTFVSVFPRLTQIRSVPMNHSLGYVAVSKNELFITDEEKTLYIYSLGQSILIGRVATISADPEGQELFSANRQIAVSDAGDRLYVVDKEYGLKTFDRRGRILNRSVCDKVQGVSGLCMDGEGGLFVCGLRSKNLVHVGSDGKVDSEIFTRREGIQLPLSVCYDRVQRRLFVSQHETNTLLVCDLE